MITCGEKIVVLKKKIKIKEIRSGFKNFKKPISQYKKIKNKKNQKIQTQVIV